MSIKVKDINIKNRTYYFFNDIIDIENSDLNNKIYRVNLLYLIFRYVNGYFEEINGNKYLMLVPTNESTQKIEKYEEIWIKIRDLIIQ